MPQGLECLRGGASIPGSGPGGGFLRTARGRLTHGKGEGAAAEKDLLPEDEMRAAHPITSG